MEDYAATGNDCGDIEHLIEEVYEKAGAGNPIAAIREAEEMAKRLIEEAKSKAHEIEVNASLEAEKERRSLVEKLVAEAEEESRRILESARKETAWEIEKEVKELRASVEPKLKRAVEVVLTYILPE